MNMNEMVGMEKCDTELKALMPREETLREQLESKKQRLEAKLAVVNAAIASLDSNPTLVQFFDAIQRGLRS